MAHTGEASAEANRLYWQTDTSVAEISQQLELSRRALYQAVQPLPAGRNCPDCGSGLVYENRSARSADDATCPTCTAEPDEDGTVPEPAAAPDADAGEQMIRVGAAALAGAAIGALATLLLVSRR